MNWYQNFYQQFRLEIDRREITLIVLFHRTFITSEEKLGNIFWMSLGKLITAQLLV